MKLLLGYVGLAILSFNLVYAADVEYSVVGFPKNQQAVAVVIGGQSYPLTQSTDSPYIYKGIAPSAEQYQYSLDNLLEPVTRRQQVGITSTGNEFFNRSQTVFNVPPLPQAYHPIYQPLMSNMNRSNEIATVILEANATGLNKILTNPLESSDYTLVSIVTYISNQEIYSFTEAGIKNSGKSTKEFAKQSYKVKLNEFKKTGTKELLYGRTTFKLRAHETDPTFVREKLMLDCLSAAGVATVQGNYVRLYINNEPFGLYLMIDDSTTNFINNALRGGNQNYEHTGPTYKGNALNPQFEGNLVYKDDLQESYNDTVYKLEDEGNMKKETNNTNEKTPLIEFIKELSLINPAQTTDANDKASNYYLTKETSSNQWVLITYDFDETFGLGAPRYMATTPYANFSRPDSQRPLVNAFIASPYYKAEFEKVIQTLVKRFFKASAITSRIEAWRQMLREDVDWDLSLEPKSVGIKPQWTLWNFENNMNNTDGESMGIIEWINTRSVAVQQQLNFNDVDDLPVLGPYTTQHNWDPNNYDKVDVKDKSAKPKSASERKESDAVRNLVTMPTTLTLIICISCIFG
ncbi:coth protein-domain-containing protein [Gilbertella persicaria]|uniref:coth protein-domain-containing protein n=1 Tax=Gilbertella persicaria TaxID=101096 RepID=UPI0022207778|nr:coth protein-domain-containing protein [Gilbertella persicaria]KAI8087712.1 coth protein-domain-containing protein [Gilbertella persicaria]